MNDKNILMQDALDIREDEIPWYRWRWFFALTFFFFSPATLVIGFTGNVYFKKVFGKNQGEVFKLPNLNKYMILVGTILLLVNNIRYFY
ncbi:hypothetical protein [Vibrio azureus]|uniref:Uncharacterized protein n=1 Tax=Vibrio azureus NBRC 104587 TaxID=1219077 RepID=U3C4K8_9VIBR|nr:hypothetical protein [Vibrio azureus]GAD76339.1 hypothetical protein VAZ01S_041_00400 [Vibrio azureus NBRC 104587]